MSELYSWVTSRTPFHHEQLSLHTIIRQKTQCQNYIVGSHQEHLSLHTIIRQKTQNTAHDYKTENTMSELYSWVTSRTSRL